MPVRQDDLTIVSEEHLWRRLWPDWVVLTPDGQYRVSSAAFKDGRREVSVNIASLTTQTQTLRGFDRQGIASIQVKTPRSLGHSIVREPEPDNVAHALICEPPDIPNKQRGRDAKTMAGSAEILVMPVI